MAKLKPKVSFVDQIRDELTQQCPIEIFNEANPDESLCITIEQNHRTGFYRLRVTVHGTNELLTIIPVQQLANFFLSRPSSWPYRAYDDNAKPLPFGIYHRQFHRKLTTTYFLPDEGWEIQSSNTEETNQTA